MSNQDTESLLDHIDGVGTGLTLLVLGLVFAIGDVGPGVLAGLPMILLGVVVPLGMTHNARTEALRQQQRRRPERESNHTYELSPRRSKGRRSR